MFVHYQERIEIVKGTYILVVDSLIPMVEFITTFMTPETCESLLSNVNNTDKSDPKNWMDNGICCVTGAPMEHRVARVICDGNYEYWEKRLYMVPKDEDLKKMYTNMRQERGLTITP